LTACYRSDITLIPLISDRSLVNLDDERKAAMISNLLVVFARIANGQIEYLLRRAVQDAGRMPARTKGKPAGGTER
jgi:hypothetical protein